MRFPLHSLKLVTTCNLLFFANRMTLGSMGWKNSCHIEESNADTSVPRANVKVAHALCKGDAVTYQVVHESGITDDWILEHIIPNMVRGMSSFWRVTARTRPVILLTGLMVSPLRGPVF